MAIPVEALRQERIGSGHRFGPFSLSRAALNARQMILLDERPLAVGVDLDVAEIMDVTECQRQILGWWMLGSTSRAAVSSQMSKKRQESGERGIGERTVAKHVERMQDRFGTHDSMGTLVRAWQVGLVFYVTD